MFGPTVEVWFTVDYGPSKVASLAVLRPVYYASCEHNHMGRPQDLTQTDYMHCTHATPHNMLLTICSEYE